MSYIYIAITVLGSISFISATILYVCSKKFAIVEDGRIGEVAESLPQANCGGCGYAGCSGFAAALVKSADEGSIDGMLCPVGGAETMTRIAGILHLSATLAEPKVAVVRCGGECEKRPKIASYDGLHTCAAISMLGVGDTACGYGCLGEGDCVAVCDFDAISINPTTGIAEVDEEKCGACGQCVKACPHGVIELRNKGVKGRRVYVDCVNKDKGAAVGRACSVSCLACGKCEKECSFGAISITQNLAYIDYKKCKLCRKCEKVCTRHTIKAVNFPQPKVKEVVEEMI